MGPDVLPVVTLCHNLSRRNRGKSGRARTENPQHSRQSCRLAGYAPGAADVASLAMLLVWRCCWSGDVAGLAMLLVWRCCWSGDAAGLAVWLADYQLHAVSVQT